MLHLIKSNYMVKREQHSDLSVNIIVTVIDGKIGRKRRRARRHRQLVNDLKDKRRYWNLIEAPIRTL